MALPFCLKSAILITRQTNWETCNVRDFHKRLNLKIIRFSCADIDFAGNKNIEFVILLFVLTLIRSNHWGLDCKRIIRSMEMQ